MDVSALLPGLSITRQVQHAAGLTLYLKSQITSSCCPACKTESSRVHGYFWRYPQDLTWAGCGIHLWLRVRRFACLDTNCPRATFSETYPDWLSPYAHRTERLKALTLKWVCRLAVKREQCCSRSAISLPARILCCADY